MLSKRLNFCPQRHFNLFDTILDVNRFVRNLTIKGHYYSADTLDASMQSVSASVNTVTVSDDFSFRKHCVIRHLEDLAQESDPLDAHSTGDGTVKSVQFSSTSDFYPVNSCTPDMAIFQKAIEQYLTALEHQAMGGGALCGVMT